MNNKPLSDKVRATLQSVTLTKDEKAALLLSLHKEMEKDPLTTMESEGGVRKSDTDRHLSHNNIIMKIQKRKFIPAVVLVALLVGGTVSYAAETTLPGDTLYPVKIHVNERVRVSLAVSDKAKAEVATKLAERRLDEATQLESEGRLTDDIRTELRHRFDDHEGRAEDNIRIIEATDATEAARIRSDLRMRIKEHSLALGALEIEYEIEDHDDDNDDSEHRGRGSDDERRPSGNTASTSSSRSRDDDSPTSGRSISSGDESDDDSRGQNSGRVGTRHDDDDDDSDEGDDEDNDDRGRGVSGSNSSSGTTPPAPLPQTPASRTFTRADVASHNSAQSCYTTMGNKVYDITAYVPRHPGGVAAITAVCGKDGASLFQGQHGGDPKPENILASFVIGDLAP